MTTCASAGPSLDICPTQDQLRTQIIAMLPRGRAWGTHDGGPYPGTVLYRFCDALAAARVFVEQRICDLRREFFCATTVEMRDIWMAEYGLPDACEPYPDLCSKVAAVGGSTCAYLAEIAASAGWSVTCLPSEQCGSRVGARAGRARAGGGRMRASVILAVDLAGSRAYGGGAKTPPLSGRLRAGRRLACPPDIDALKCLIARIAPAHVAQVYVLAEPRFGQFDFSVPGNILLAVI